MPLLKLNLGCEYNRLIGYINIDIDPQTKPDRVANAKDLSFLSDSSVCEIISSHLLEHFLESEVHPALREWNRVLTPGGTLYLVVPDIEKAFRLWLAGQIKDDELVRGFIGADQEKTPFMLHKTFFWKSRLFTLLSESNFDRIEEINQDQALAWLQVKCQRKG